ncbi:aldehyde dehydrogenase family protein [Marinobacterium sp. CAU 1594]|nr:aldehyde dehydrogenase family protein [Marinobacterium arenosum]
MKSYTELYIDGGWTPANGQDRAVINPATEAIIASVREADASDVDRAVSAARRAFDSWAATSAEQRSRYIAAICDKLEQRQEQLARTITEEMGMPLHLSRGWQVAGPISGMRAYIERAYLMEQLSGDSHSVISREPIGVCAFITPWNVPLHQLVGKVAPALAAGCTMVLKPSEMTPLHAYLFAEVVDEVGLPAGVFNLVCGDGPAVGAPLCRHPQVDMVSFTGSTGAGVKIAQAAAPSIKRVCQELGGKSPFIITEDADFSAAIEYGVRDVMVNSGQICCSLTRMLVPQNRYQEAVELARQVAEGLQVGDPMDDNSFMGPLSSAAQRERVRSYISRGVEEGATLVTGGMEPPVGLDQGYYVRPTIFANVDNRMAIAREEIFGPVLCLIPYRDIDEAISIANDTPYGLSAAVWAADAEQAQQIGRKIRAGQVNVNGGGWNYTAPFGGYKQSGNGREWGDEGLAEFVEIKSMQFP